MNMSLSGSLFQIPALSFSCFSNVVVQGKESGYEFQRAMSPEWITVDHKKGCVETCSSRWCGTQRLTHTV